MERYEAYKDSGVEWIGEVPEKWITYPFRKFFSFSKGLAITKANLVEKGLPVISYGQIHSKSNSGVKSHPELLRYISEDDGALSGSAMTVAGDIVFADTSEDSDGCGNCFYIDRDGVYAGYHTFIAHPLQLGWERYHSYLFQSDEWRSQVRSRATGVKLFSITQRILGGNTLLLPTKEEATIIADYLDEKTAEIDSIVSETERSIELLREYRKSVISEAVTKGLDPNAPMKDSGIEWIGEIPDAWGLPKLGTLTAKIGSGKTPHGGADVYQDQGVPFLRSQNVYDSGLVFDETVYISAVTDAEMSSTRVYQGDVLLNITGGSIGRCCVYNHEEHANVNQHVCIIRSNGTVLPKWIQAFWNSDSGQTVVDAYQTGANREGLNFEQIASARIPFPALHEQSLIIDYLDVKTAEIDAFIADKERQVELLKEYRKSLISEAVTGKFKVPGVS